MDLLSEIKAAYAADPLLRQPTPEVSLNFSGGVWLQENRLYVPEVTRLEVLRLIHDSKIGGHRGITKTQEFLARYFWWPSYRKDVEGYVSSCEQNLEALKTTLTTAQERYKRAADRTRRPAPVYRVGDTVWLSTKNLRVRAPTVKLGQKFVGPYKIVALVNSVAVRLKLPPAWKVHPVFHVSLLKPVVPNSFPGRTSSPPAPVLVDGHEQYVVEKILDSRIFRRKLQYLVKWQGYSVKENSWEPLPTHC
ncbi:uncharacterized protein [Dendrobates tinctorius]|uniref:uncharacterized protein n=1 Tax=Dendrobates tinctorius TaxID=92724 RepID=UPI003CC93997